MKPMLAADCDGDILNLKYPVLCSPKIDGIRCLVVDGKAVTRSLKPQPNKVLRELFSDAALNGLDGELVVPGVTFQETTSRVMGRSNDPEGVEWHVFDDVTEPNVTFADRLARAASRIAALALEGPVIQKGDALDRVRIVTHKTIRSSDELAAYEEVCLAQGYEGVMIRDPSGKYKHGRSTLKEGGLLKLKRFTDAEATIIGFEEKMHNANEAKTNELGRTKRSSSKDGLVPAGVLGAFILRLPSGVEFNCGSGLNDFQRKKWWTPAYKAALTGKLVKFKYQAHGTDVAPRSPIFLGIRDESDL